MIIRDQIFTIGDIVNQNGFNGIICRYSVSKAGVITYVITNDDGKTKVILEEYLTKTPKTKEYNI